MDPALRISVVLCTYNGAEFVSAQLDSILSQTYPVMEVIVQDDRSTDGTLGILQEYSRRDDRVRVFSVDERRGVNHNFITAFDKAQGDLVAWSDQDDIWLPDKLEKQVADLQRKDLWVSFHITRNFVGVPPEEIGPYDRRTPNFGLERELFLGTVPGHTMLIHRDLHQLTRSRVPEEELETSPFYYDTILSIVANAYCKVDIIVEPLDLHRRLQTSVSGPYKTPVNFQRSVPNAIRQVFRCMVPRRRRAIRPLIRRRMDSMTSLLDHFPDAGQTGNVRRIIKAYRSPARLFSFPLELIRNRDRVLFTKEKNGFVAVVRAALFAITYQDYFSSAIE